MAIGVYRTYTYIAADFDHDKDAVDQLVKWNNSNHWGLSFKNVHDATSSRDSSRPCSIKASLKERMDVSKTFVLIVGESTASLRKGSCQFCDSKTYDFWQSRYTCNSGKSYDTRSFIEYECEKAVNAGINIIVLYKSTRVDRNKCPETIRWRGQHVAMKIWNAHTWQAEWNYSAVKQVFDNI